MVYMIDQWEAQDLLLTCNICLLFRVLKCLVPFPMIFMIRRNVAILK